MGFPAARRTRSPALASKASRSTIANGGSRSCVARSYEAAELTPEQYDTVNSNSIHLFRLRRRPKGGPGEPVDELGGHRLGTTTSSPPSDGHGRAVRDRRRDGRTRWTHTSAGKRALVQPHRRR